MKDYSNFINGFITKYEIKDNKILIYTPHTKKNEPVVKPLTKDNLKKCEDRLENQYKMIAEHQEEIIKFNNKKVEKYLTIWIIISSIITTSSFCAALPSFSQPQDFVLATPSQEIGT